MSSRHPNFLVAGAQKCGTSYLCALLSQHRQVFHSTPKEPLYFQRQDVDDSTFGEYLRRHFANAGSEPRVGEGSTVYFQWPNALSNIVNYLGSDIKVIISLRHPTDRAISYYLHNVRKGRLRGSEPICRVGDDVRMSPVLSSLYSEHVERWLESYGENVCFLRFDDLLASPTRFVRQATDFLALSPLGEIRRKAVNKGFGLEWRDNFLEVADVDSEILCKPRFSVGELEDLHARFAEDIDRTERLLGWDLSEWRRMPAFTAKQAGW